MDPPATMQEGEQRSSPLAGPGTTRHNRKLQLRKNGFRGRALPNRNITPKRNSLGTWSSPVQEEAATPVAAATPTPTTAAAAAATTTVASPEPAQAESSKQGFSSRGRSSSILQEVSNSSLRRKANKVKHDSIVSVFQDENGEGASNKSTPWKFDSSPACLPPEAPNLTRSRKKHQRNKSVRSNEDSELADQHISYLEAELAAYQSQIASLTSPSMAKEKTQKLRMMNLELKRLRDENTRWENDFDERVDEVTEEHTEIESTLRARINLLELDMENHVQKVKELQAQLDATKKALEIAESANVEFEKRLETFAHLLVTSPKKLETPLAQPPFSNGSKRHTRQKLSLHRFPTTGSLPQTQTIQVGQDEPSTEPAVTDHLDTASDVEYDTSKDFLADRPLQSSLNLQDVLARDVPPSRNRTSRRMRRFHGGSHNPKPLILSAAQLSPIASAPVLDPSLVEFPFPDVPLFTRRNTYHDISPLTGRRRAMTSVEAFDVSDMPDIQPLPALPTFPASSIPMQAELSSSEESKPPTPPSNVTESTPRDYSSIGPNLGRSLFEELCNARQNPDTESSSEYNTVNSRPEIVQRRVTSTSSRRSLHQRSKSDHSALATYARVPSLHTLQSVPSSRSPSPTPRDRGILSLLAELWRAPFALARRCVYRAHSALVVSRTLHKLQWWLVHLLLGPMATRHLMSCTLQDTLLLSPTDTLRLARNNRSPSPLSSEFEEEEVAEGSPCPRPTTTPSPHTETEDLFSRHSPWLWVKFSITLAFAIGAAIKDGPGSLIRPGEREGCTCLACVKKSN